MEDYGICDLYKAFGFIDIDLREHALLSGSHSSTYGQTDSFLLHALLYFSCVMVFCHYIFFVFPALPASVSFFFLSLSLSFLT